MPDVSIAVSAKDNFSSTLRTMSSNTKAFSKDMDLLQDKLNKISRTKASLTVDVADAKRALKEAQKEYQNLSADASEADKAAARAKFETAQENLDNLKASVKALGSAYKDTTHEMEDLAGTATKIETSSAIGSSSPAAASGGGGLEKFAKSLIGAGLFNMIGDSVGQYAEYATMSRLGKPTATMIGSTLSGMASGAAMGSVAGPVGAVIGAGVGALAGSISGNTQIQTEKDEAYKSYVQDAVQGVQNERAEMLASGSAIAGGRETDLISFTTLLGGDQGKAESFLADTREMAKRTPFYYDDLTAMSKTLMTFGYGMNEIFPTLTAVGDTGAALGLSTSDMDTVSKAIGRMRSTDKVSLEYLNMLTERGIGATQWIADEYGMSIGKVYDNISKGKFDGSEVAQLILDKMAELYGGAMENQSQTFEGLTSTLEGMKQEVENAYGEGYDETRKQGMQEEIAFYESESGKRLEDAYRKIGEYEASLENLNEQYIREALEAALESEEYKTAELEGNGEEMGRILAEAKIHGQAEYDAGPGKEKALQSQLDLIESVQSDPAILDAYETAGYALGNALSKGIENCININFKQMMAEKPVLSVSQERRLAEIADARQEYQLEYDGSHASGLQRVPYNNYLAVLHEGEQVLTAREARNARSAAPVTITGNQFTVREEADIDKIAWALYDRIREQALAAAP